MTGKVSQIFAAAAAAAASSTSSASIHPSMASSVLCSFPGCSKPASLSSSPDHDQPPVACDDLHHLQLMCLRFCHLHPHLSPPLRPFFSLSRSPTCALLFCPSPCPDPHHPWCSQSHYLQWLRNFCSLLHSSQICRLRGCTKHVFVELGPPPKAHEFCSWNHRQRFHMSASMPHVANRQEPREVVASDQQSKPTVKYIIDALKEHVHNNAKLPKNVAVDENFFSKHPWEVLVKPDDESCLFVTRHNFKGKVGAPRRMKNRTTKENYHWKPTGHPNVGGGVTWKYLTYKRISKAVGSDEANERCFSMIEYTIDGLQDYCVIYLYRGRSSQASQKANPRKKPKLCAGETQTENDSMWQKNEACDGIAGGNHQESIERRFDIRDGDGNIGPSSVLYQNGKDQDVCGEQDGAGEPGTSHNSESSLCDVFLQFLPVNQDHEFDPLYDSQKYLHSPGVFYPGIYSSSGFDLLEP